MRDEIELLRAAKPTARGPSAERAREARGKLMMEIAGSQPVRSTNSRWRRHRGYLRFALPAAALIAAGALVVSLSERGSGTAWAAELVRVAEAAPRLLLAEDDWRVTRADQFSADFGEMTFSNGERQLDLHWQPARQYPSLVKDRGFDLRSRAPVAGTEARIFRYEGTSDFVAIWLMGDSALEARGIARNLDSFVGELAALHEVDVDTWLAAMPDSVIQPASRAEVVGEMLKGIPLPPGFDIAPLTRGEAIRDRYQLGAEVAAAVACEWIGGWVMARRTDDENGVRRAVEAMASSRGWPILHEMDEAGDYPEVLWAYADAIAADGHVMGGRSLTVEESYRNALGCRSS